MKNLCSGTHRGGFQFLLILDLWGISFHAVVVFGLGKNLLFKSVLEHCELWFLEIFSNFQYLLKSWKNLVKLKLCKKFKCDCTKSLDSIVLKLGSQSFLHYASSTDRKTICDWYVRPYEALFDVPNIFWKKVIFKFL